MRARLRWLALRDAGVSDAERREGASLPAKTERTCSALACEVDTYTVGNSPNIHQKGSVGHTLYVGPLFFSPRSLRRSIFTESWNQ